MIKIKRYETDRVNVAIPFYHKMIYDGNFTVKQWTILRGILDGSDKNSYIGINKVYFTYI